MARDVRQRFLGDAEERQLDLRREPRDLLAADDWHVYFRGKRALNRLDNQRSRMGFELFGDPSAFRR